MTANGSSPLLVLESLVNLPFFHLRNALKLTRRNYSQTPCRDLQMDSQETLKRIKALKSRYDVAFEKHLAQSDAFENYHVLDVLTQAREVLGFEPKPGLILADAGCKNFYYARALAAFFKPALLTGIEVDAYKLYRDFHTRFSYAEFYLRDLTECRYRAMDFLKFQEPLDGLTMLLPFVTPYPLVKWTLPLSLFKPKPFFAHAFALVKPGGWLFMMNQSEDEEAAAHKLAETAGFKLKGKMAIRALSERDEPPRVSWWGRS